MASHHHHHHQSHAHRTKTNAVHDSNVLAAFQAAVNATATLQAEMWLANMSAGKQKQAAAGSNNSVSAGIVVDILDNIQFQELAFAAVNALKSLQEEVNAYKRNNALHA